MSYGVLCTKDGKGLRTRGWTNKASQHLFIYPTLKIDKQIEKRCKFTSKIIIDSKYISFSDSYWQMEPYGTLRNLTDTTKWISLPPEGSAILFQVANRRNKKKEFVPPQPHKLILPISVWNTLYIMKPELDHGAFKEMSYFFFGVYMCIFCISSFHFQCV